MDLFLCLQQNSKGGVRDSGGQLLMGFRVKAMHPGREISAAMHERDEGAAAYEPQFGAGPYVV